MKHIEFIEDTPIPKSNILIYQEIYCLEQWLRRILFTALVAKDGKQWFDSIPPKTLDELKKRRGMLRGRIYLGSEDNSDLLWLSTIEELRIMFRKEEIWPIIKKMTLFNEVEFDESIDVLREIRNIIGHNRATTEKTKEICEVYAKYLRKGVTIFKERLGLFAGYPRYEDETKKIFIEQEKYQETESFKELQEYLVNEYGEGPEIQLLELEYFRVIGYTSYSYPEENQWIDIFEALKTYKALESSILAISLFLGGNNYGVLWPKSISLELQCEIIRIFVSTQSNLWTEISYENQSPRFLGNPRIWFYGEEFISAPDKKPDNEDTPLEFDENSDIEKPKGDNIIPFPKSR